MQLFYQHLIKMFYLTYYGHNFFPYNRYSIVIVLPEEKFDYSLSFTLLFADPNCLFPLQSFC